MKYLKYPSKINPHLTLTHADSLQIGNVSRRKLQKKSGKLKDYKLVKQISAVDQTIPMWSIILKTLLTTYTSRKSGNRIWYVYRREGTFQDMFEQIVVMLSVKYASFSKSQQQNIIIPHGNSTKHMHESCLYMLRHFFYIIKAWI